jgi:DNA ligase (NAD+)
MNNLLNELLRADHEYYINGISALSDAEYDHKKHSFKSENPDHPYCKTVGTPPPAGTVKVKHTIVAGSQEKLASAEDIKGWTGKYPGEMFSIGYKGDGITLVLTYKDGLLVDAVTRGDGVEGESVLANALLMDSVKKQLREPLDIVVRGETMLFKENFKKYFAPLGYSNERNSVACIRDQKGTGLAKHLTFVAFDIFNSDGSPVTTSNGTATTECDNHNIMDYLGFTPISTIFMVMAPIVQATHDAMEAAKENIPYITDGTVVRYQSLAVQAAMGMTNDMCPRGQRCIKWVADTAETTVTGYTLSMGSTGAIIPTFNLNTVNIGSVEVSSVLMNNFGYVAKYGAGVGDKVLISRRGGVIPHLEELVSKGENRTPILPPEECPVCGSKTKLVRSEKEEDVAVLYCTNDSCEGKGVQRVKAWIKKTNILFIGDVLLQELYDNHDVKMPHDIYKLTEQYLSKVEVGSGVYGANASRTMAEIEKSRSLPLHTFIGSLCVRFLGREEAKNIMKKLNISTLEGFMAIKPEDLLSVEGYKDKKAYAIVEGLQNAKEEVEALLAVGVKVAEEKAEEVPVVTSGGLLGSSFCFTGAVNRVSDAGERYTRKMLQALVLANGGSVVDDVKAGTTYLVQADPSSTSSKTKAAAKHGTKVVSEENFFKMIGM